MGSLGRRQPELYDTTIAQELDDLLLRRAEELGVELEIVHTNSEGEAVSRIYQADRAKVDGVLCDVVCSGRFYDFLEKRKGRWGIVLRRLAYEKDRIDPVEPDAKLTLDKTLLAQFPEGYRHLGYLQSKIGYTIKDELPGLDGPPLDALYAKGEAWLKGRKL